VTLRRHEVDLKRLPLGVDGFEPGILPGQV